jgi:hypothetical protein
MLTSYMRNPSNGRKEGCDHHDYGRGDAANGFTLTDAGRTPLRAKLPKP